MVAVVVAAALGGAACTGGDDPPPTTAATAPSAPPTTMAVVEDSDAAIDYFAALASRDPEQTTVMLTSSSPGSTANDYARHQVAARRILGADEPGFVEADDVSAIVCAGPPEPEQDVVCSTYEDFAFDPEGRLTGFTVGGEGLASRLSVDGPPTVVDRITVQHASAYRSPATETLFVVLDVINESANDFELFAFAATYRPAEDEPVVEALGAWGETTLAAGASGQVLVRFADAELGGVVNVSGWSDVSVGVTFVVQLAASNP